MKKKIAGLLALLFAMVAALTGCSRGTIDSAAVRDSVIETMEEFYIVEAHAEELGISLSDEEKAAAAESAKAFLAANDQKTLSAMSADEPTVTHVLELMALQSKARAEKDFLRDELQIRNRRGGQ